MQLAQCVAEQLGGRGFLAAALLGDAPGLELGGENLVEGLAQDESLIPFHGDPSCSRSGAPASDRSSERQHGSVAEGETDQVEEERGGEAERVDAVENAAVAGEQRAEILDAAIASTGIPSAWSRRSRHSNGFMQPVKRREICQALTAAPGTIGRSASSHGGRRKGMRRISPPRHDGDERGPSAPPGACIASCRWSPYPVRRHSQ